MALLNSIRKTLLRTSDEDRARKKCIRKFLYYFPKGYQGTKYLEWERNYKWNAHIEWQEKLNKNVFRKLLDEEQYSEIAKRTLAIESRTNLLFSFEKMALRDAVKTTDSAKKFAEGLFNWLHGPGTMEKRFISYRNMMQSLPVKQTRVVTWPALTIFGFIADPEKFIYLKPTVTKIAAQKYKFPFRYSSKPNWDVYASLLEFAEQLRVDTAKFHPRDMIDLQSFIWVLGSEEYPD